MDDQDKILSFMRFTGPVLPAQVAKHINSNILLASAHLSDLISQGKVKASHLKIGSSPLYYLPEHKEKLLNFLHNLNPKDQETLNLLKEKKLLRESNLDLFSRVSLRNIKDFALPLNFIFNNQKELFWRWYLLDETEAGQLIKAQLEKPLPPPPAETKPEPLLKPEIPPFSVKEEPKPIIQQKLVEDEKLKKPLIQKLKDKFKPKRNPPLFFSQLESFFREHNLKIKSQETLRKNAEINFILEVTSVIGKITYFCKAKNKKRCDEKDLSAAYMEAQSRKLPLFFLYAGELSPKAKELLDSGAFENLVVKKLG